MKKRIWPRLLGAGALLLLTLGLGLIWQLTTLLIYRPVLISEKALSDRDFRSFVAVNCRQQGLQGWWYEGAPGAPTVLLCHGHGVNSANMNDMVAFLRPLGYHLLLLDFRSHGVSSGTYTSIGLQEWEDLDAILGRAAALGFLASASPLVAYGRSMGAATLANGASHLPRIQAFVLESCFSRLRRVAARDAARLFGIPDNALIDVVFQVAEWRSGIPYAANSPQDNIAGIASRPVLLIHDEFDPRATADQFESLCERLPNARVLRVAAAGHVQAHAVNPELFRSTFLDFLQQAGMPPVSASMPPSLSGPDKEDSLQQEE